MSLAITISKQMIRDINSLGEGLEDWEKDHLANYTKRLDAGKELTRKQGETLHGIFTRRIKFAKAEDGDAPR